MSVNYYQEIITSISNIENDKSAIATAISEKGVTVPQDASLGDYAALIASIPTGGGTSDSSVKLGIKCGAMYTEYDNAGLFNTGYVPGPDTIIRFSGTICTDGQITHGSFDADSGYNVYRIFGFEGGSLQVFYDRDSDAQLRLYYDIDGTYHTYEFGNFYIKVDDEIVAQDSSISSSWSTDIPICIFGGLNHSGTAEGYFGEGGDCALFEIYEPSETPGEDNVLMKQYIAANDASGNICWYETLSGTFLYPTGTFSGAANPNEDPYIYAPDSSTEPSPTPTPTPDPSTDSSVTTYDVMAVNGGYEGLFNTGYVPTKDTVVKFQGSMVGQGDISHGIFTTDAEEQGSFRIFGLSDTLFFDRDGQGNVRISSELSSLENHEYEFGNFYIKVDNSIVAQDSSLDSNWSLPSSIPLCIFGALDENGEEHYAGSGELITWFEIWEPENGTLTLQKRYVPAKDASDNACLYESVNEDVIYPTEGSDFNVYNNI